MKNKKILIGVTGGIACYKICDLVSKLYKDGNDVRVIMTGNSTEFVSALTFETLSHNRVYCDTFRSENSYEINHIALSDWADVMLVAPASANIIAKFAQGIADDLLTTTYLAVKCPVLIAPAMNTNMLDHPATVENLAVLKSRGNYVIDPSFGYLACNKVGSGRLADINDIVISLKRVLSSNDFNGKHVIVTAGGTREPIDAVRYITNRSSGRMGHSLAEAAYVRGASVTLITASDIESVSSGINVIRCSSAAEMRDCVFKNIDCADILIMSAAVSDYTPSVKHEGKIKKKNGMTLELERTVDILKEVGSTKSKDLYLVGFAAETDNLIGYAESKLKEKNLNMVVANDVSDKRIGFDSTENAVTIIKRSGDIFSTDIKNKSEISDIILDEIIKDI